MTFLFISIFAIIRTDYPKKNSFSRITLPACMCHGNLSQAMAELVLSSQNELSIIKDRGDPTSSVSFPWINLVFYMSFQLSNKVLSTGTLPPADPVSMSAHGDPKRSHCETGSKCRLRLDDVTCCGPMRGGAITATRGRLHLRADNPHTARARYSGVIERDTNSPLLNTHFLFFPAVFDKSEPPRPPSFQCSLEAWWSESQERKRPIPRQQWR